MIITVGMFALLITLLLLTFYDFVTLHDFQKEVCSIKTNV